MPTHLGQFVYHIEAVFKLAMLEDLEFLLQAKLACFLAGAVGWGTVYDFLSDSWLLS